MSRPRTILAAAAAFAAIASATPAAADADPHKGHAVPRLATTWVKAWRTSDTQDLARLFTRDAVYTDNGVGKVSRGRAGVATWEAGTHQLIADVDATLVDAFRSGNRMVIETVYRGHIAGAPRPFAVPMVTVLHLRGGRIASDTDTYNLNVLLAQSGLPLDWTPAGAASTAG